ncbi:MAG TPA: hypothetical protein VKE51_10300 [Vicinamibacterales bacterium]|nr:hypothetical protein [Vicinamibacterales bacterium]
MTGLTSRITTSTALNSPHWAAAWLGGPLMKHDRDRRDDNDGGR